MRYYALFVRLFGWYLVYSTLDRVPKWVVDIFNMKKEYQWAGMHVPNYTAMLSATGFLLVSSILLSIFMIKFPITFARLLSPYPEDAYPVADFKDQKIQAIAFSIIGLYMVTDAFPYLVYNIVSYWGSPSYQKETLDLIKIKAYFVSNVIQIAIGVYLVFGSSGLVKIITKLRGQNPA